MFSYWHEKQSFHTPRKNLIQLSEKSKFPNETSFLELLQGSPFTTSLLPLSSFMHLQNSKCLFAGVFVFPYFNNIFLLYWNSLSFSSAEIFLDRLRPNCSYLFVFFSKRSWSLLRFNFFGVFFVVFLETFFCVFKFFNW